MADIHHRSISAEVYPPPRATCSLWPFSIYQRQI